MRTEDGYVIHKCINGEPEAFGFLVDKYKASIYAFAYTKLRNFRDAEDVTQEVFIQAYQKLRTLRQWDSFLAWLYAMTSNRCKNLIRSRQSRPDAEFIEDQDPEDLVKPSLDSYRESLTLEMVQDALDSLPETYRQVLTLHYLGGMTCKEIATFLRTSPAAIKKRLSRARPQLKEEILAMMSATYDQQRLRADFTFRIVELVKRMRINPVSTVRWLPWGLSLGTGLIFTVLSFFPQLLPSMNPTISSMNSSLAGEASALDKTEIPVDMIEVSEMPSFSMQRGDDKGMNSKQAPLHLDPQREGDTWTGRADMPMERYSLAASTVNGKIYAIGGAINWGQVVYPTLQEYDPKTDKWTQKADMPTARQYLASVALNGKFYAIGGLTGNVVYPILEEYDPASDRWTRKADMSTPRWGLAACVANGKIYAMGGMLESAKFLSTVEEYDPKTDKWAQKADMPTMRGGLGVCTVNGKIYAIGGGNEMDQSVFDVDGLSIVEEYDPITDTWVRKADMPTARVGLSAVAVNGKIYAIGGSNQLNNQLNILCTMEEYDPKTDRWTRKADMPDIRSVFGADAVNGRIYAIGGYNGTWLSRVDEYDTGFAGESVNLEGKLPARWGEIKGNHSQGIIRRDLCRQ